MRLLAISFLVLGATFASAQEPRVSRLSHEPSSLRELAEGLLFDPVVLVEVGVRAIQLREAHIRLHLETALHLKEMLELMAAEEPDRGALIARVGGFMEKVAGPLVQITDLDEDQQHRAKQIAARRYPFSALATAEVQIALSLTKEQRQLIAGISSQREELLLTVAVGMSRRIPELEDLRRTASSSEDEYDQAFGRWLFKTAPVLIAGILDLRALGQEQHAQQVLESLSPEQRSIFTRLKGEPVATAEDGRRESESRRFCSGWFGFVRFCSGDDLSVTSVSLW
jgi:hypothetical protein